MECSVVMDKVALTFDVLRSLGDVAHIAFQYSLGGVLPPLAELEDIVGGKLYPNFDRR